jgi:tetratricopeptide (TPR) repeat protein
VIRSTVVVCAIAVAVAVAVSAHAQDPQDAVRAHLSEGEHRYQEQEYRAAVEAFTAVVRDPVATRDQRARAYEYLGMSWLILGKKARAREAFEELLAIDPHYTLSDPTHSPKLREFFEDVRSSFVPGYGRGAGEAELEHAAPTGATAGRPVEMAVVVIRGAPLVKMVMLHQRRQGLLTYSVEPLRGEGGRFRLSFTPPRDSADYTLEYYLEARDEHERVVARVASPERPIALPVHGAPTVTGPQPWFKRWYVWAAVGAVVAGAAVGGILYGTAERAPKGTLPPGTVSLGLRF